MGKRISELPAASSVLDTDRFVVNQGGCTKSVSLAQIIAAALNGECSVSTPTIVNTTLTTANTEYSHIFGADTKKFTIKNRGAGQVKIAYILGDSGTTYITIWPGGVYEAPCLDLSATLTVYMQSPKASQLIEIASWA